MSHLIPSVCLPSFKPLFPQWYDKIAHWNYHANNKRHLMKNCIALKFKVHELFKAGALTFGN